MANRKKPALPKSVLDMKFMKKTKDRIERELQNTQDLEGLYSNVITNEMRHATGNYISESSFIFCEDLIDGRVSFKGMNPEIEALMELERKNDDEDISEMQKDVSDEILSKKMNSLKKRKWSSSPSSCRIKRKRK